MTERRAVVSAAGPQPTATYPHANIEAGYVWVTAQAGRDPSDGELVPGGLEGQLERAVSNLAAILADCGSSLDNVLQTMVMVVGDPEETLIDSVFARRFKSLPARTIFGVAFLAAEPGHETVRVQLDCLAWL